MSLMTMGVDTKDPSAQQVVRTLVEAATRDHRVRTSEVLTTVCWGPSRPHSAWKCTGSHSKRPDPGSPRRRRLARSLGRW